MNSLTENFNEFKEFLNLQRSHPFQKGQPILIHVNETENLTQVTAKLESGLDSSWLKSTVSLSLN